MGARRTDLFLTVLFPILIAVGIAMGMDSTSSIEFSLARTALMIAAAIPVFLAFLLFRQAELSPNSIGTLIGTVAVVGGALGLGFKWIDFKENIICRIVPAWYAGEPGPYKLSLFNSGIFPAINVRVRIQNVHEQIGSDSKYINLGDFEPESATPLDALPPLMPGTYQIDFRQRSGKFVEILSFEKRDDKLSIKYVISRLGSGTVVMESP
jgi:hypothetical protein